MPIKSMLVDVWKRYRTFIVVSLCVIVLLVCGLRYYLYREYLCNVKASLIYENLSHALAENNIPEAEHHWSSLQSDFPRSGYTALGMLMQARFEIEHKNYDAGLTSLKWVIDHSLKYPHFQQIARIRMARVLLMQKKYPEALLVLSAMDAIEFKPAVDEVRGDIYVAQQNIIEAKKSYRDAILAFKAIGVQHAALVRKADAL